MMITNNIEISIDKINLLFLYLILFDCALF